MFCLGRTTCFLPFLPPKTTNSICFSSFFYHKNHQIRFNSTNNNKNNNNKNNNNHPSPEEEDKKNSFGGGFSLSRPIETILMRSGLTSDHDLARFVSKAAAVSIYTIAGLTILGTFGVDTKPFITGFGITGFTIGFALKEIATNFLSGVMLVFAKPFQKGQYLQVLGTPAGTTLEGVVESIDARYVLLRNKENSLVMIPSVVVYSNSIVVNSIKPGATTIKTG